VFRGWWAGQGASREGVSEFYNEARYFGYAAGGSYDTGEAMCSRNRITVLGFVTTPTEQNG